MSMKNYQSQYQFPVFPIQTDHRLDHHQDHLPMQMQQSFNDILSSGGSSSHYEVDHSKENDSVNWMSSKMNLVKKMLGSDNKNSVKKQRKTRESKDQVHLNQASSSSSNNSPKDIIRVCSNCSTSKTPLWRSGPQGPKTLCNACGIRQMKARRAMRQAAEISNVDRTVPFKKRFKIASPPKQKFGIDDINMNSSNKSAFQQTLPQDEKDAAILLMTLSCGLIHG